jgi:NAD(P) transhydrogenase subunit alpha
MLKAGPQDSADPDAGPALSIDFGDEVLDSACVVHDGVVRHEPTRELIDGPSEGSV